MAKCLLLLLLCLLLSSAAVRPEDSLALLNQAVDAAGKAKHAEENVVNTVKGEVNKAHDAASSAVSAVAGHTRTAVDKTKQTVVNATERNGGKAYDAVKSGSTVNVVGLGRVGLLVVGWFACLMMGWA